MFLQLSVSPIGDLHVSCVGGRMKPDLSAEDISLYLQHLVTVETPRAGRDGLLLFRCPVRSQPPHDISMDSRTGKWLCLRGMCGRGDIFDYHWIKFKIPRQRQAENAVVNIIRETQDSIRKAEEAIRAARYGTIEDCPAFVKSLLRLIDRHPSGISRRDFQQKAHLPAQQFRKSSQGARAQEPHEAGAAEAYRTNSAHRVFPCDPRAWRQIGAEISGIGDVNPMEPVGFMNSPQGYVGLRASLGWATSRSG